MYETKSCLNLSDYKKKEDRRLFSEKKGRKKKTARNLFYTACFCLFFLHTTYHHKHQQEFWAHHDTATPLYFSHTSGRRPWFSCRSIFYFICHHLSSHVHYLSRRFFSCLVPVRFLSFPLSYFFTHPFPHHLEERKTKVYVYENQQYHKFLEESLLGLVERTAR